jgi:hypothetical protein
MSWTSTVPDGISTKLQEQPWFHCRQRQAICLFSTSFRSALRPIQTLLQSVPRDPSLRVKRREREADNSFSSTTKVKNTCCYTSPIRCCLIKHKENSPLYLYLQAEPTPRYPNFISWRNYITNYVSRIPSAHYSAAVPAKSKPVSSWLSATEQYWYKYHCIFTSPNGCPIIYQFLWNQLHDIRVDNAKLPYN